VTSPRGRAPNIPASAASNLSVLFQDLRYALRSLVANRSVTIVAVACLSLGIGINAAMFSVVDGVMIQPFPFANPDRLVVLYENNPKRGVNQSLLSYLDYRDWRDSSTTLADAAAFQGRSLTISDGQADPERFLGQAVSANLFRLLGIPPVLGRDFEPADDRPGAEPVIILSDAVWRQRYQSDPNILGRAIPINGRPHTIIGVMPPRFAFPTNHQLWVPLGPTGELAPRNERSVQVFGRMKPDVTMEQLRADLDAVAGRLAAAYPVDNEGYGAVVRPLRDWMLPTEVSVILTAMMGAATLVLLIACTNVANLLLARASVRSREIAVRSALGASRWQIVRQLLIEAVFIGGISAPLGWVVAHITLDLVDKGMPPDGVPYFIQWSLDVRSLLYTVAISLLTGVIFGLAPALHAARANLQESLKEGGRGTSGGRARLRNALVVVEVALSLVLLISATLFVRSFLNLQSSSVGFDTAPLMTMRFFMPGTAYESAESRARRVEDVVGRIEATPGVQSTFASNFVPLGGGGGGGRILVDGTTAEPGKEPFIFFIAVTPGFLKTMMIPLVRGRDMTAAEGRSRTPVAFVNQTMAKQMWGDGDPVGRRFRLMGERIPDWFTVIGVVSNFRHFAGTGDPNQVPPPSAYVPYPFEPMVNTGLTIRTAGDPASITSAVREQIRQADSSLPVYQIRSMEELRQFSFWQRRLFGWMFGVGGAVALLLATIGVYGVLSYSVAQRTQEIGVRVALGAGRGRIVRLVIGQGVRLALVGVALGLLASAAATQYIRTVLYNVRATDPATFGGVALFLIAVAALASYVPARRATAVDPLTALRAE
jgi:putative ABC transport system permease protein